MEAATEVTLLDKVRLLEEKLCIMAEKLQVVEDRVDGFVGWQQRQNGALIVLQQDVSAINKFLTGAMLKAICALLGLGILSLAGMVGMYATHMWSSK